MPHRPAVPTPTAALFLIPLGSAVVASVGQVVPNIAPSGKEAGGPQMTFRWAILCPSFLSLLCSPTRHLTAPRIEYTHDCGHFSSRSLAMGWHQLQTPSAHLRHTADSPGHQQPELLPWHSQAAKGSPFGIVSSWLSLESWPRCPSPSLQGLGAYQEVGTVGTKSDVPV